MFSKIIATFILLISVVTALQINSAPLSVIAGQSYNITYTPVTGSSVSLLLRKGDPGNLLTISTISSSLTGDSYLWTVPTDLVSADDYALEIRQSSTDSNYWGPITLAGASAASATVSSIATLPTSSGLTVVSSALTDSTSLSTSSLSTRSTSSSTRTSSSATNAPTASSVPQSNDASYLASPLALVLGAGFAIMYLQ